MFRDVVKFELIYRFRRPVVYLFAGLFFMMTFGAIASDSMQLGGSIGNAARNAPYEIIRMLSMMSVMGLLALTGFVATAVNRDREYRTSEFFFATPTSKSAYLLGRFTGSFLTAVVAVCFSGLGIVVASRMPWLDPERILAFAPRPYLYAIGVYVIPNLLCAGALLFAFATLTRRVLYTYIAMIGFLMLWAIGQATLGDLDATTVGAILDPFGKTSLDLATRYWTVVEKNTLLPALTGTLALNRLLWVAVGAGALGFTVARFRMGVVEEKLKPERTRGRAPAVEAARPASLARSGLPHLVFTPEGAVAVPEPRPVLDFSLRSRGSSGACPSWSSSRSGSSTSWAGSSRRSEAPGATRSRATCSVR
jgi:ABC-2 type transport system permease protein